MPSAGALVPPQIIPLSKRRLDRPSTHIDTETYIELVSEIPHTKIYFTTDGTRPCPFQRYIGSREVTFKYRGPFTLKSGKRVLKVISVTRDGLLESAVVTKTFQVDEVEYCESGNECPYEKFSTGRPGSARFERSRSKNSKKLPKKTAWISKSDDNFSDTDNHSNDRELVPVNNSAAETLSNGSVPDQPFHATNYSGTQVNIWGIPPEQVSGLQVDPDKADFTKLGMMNSGMGMMNPVLMQQQLGQLAQQMMQKLESDRQSTIQDIKKTVKKQLEETPQIKQVEDIPLRPPLNPISPANGNWREQLDHLYAHMLNFAEIDPDFRASISYPKFGSITSAELVGDDDGYTLTVNIGNAGARKKKKLPAAKSKTKPKLKPPPPQPVPENEIEPTEVAEIESEPEPELEKDPDPYFVAEDYHQEGTLKPYSGFDAEKDCEKLRKAMKRLGTDEQAIIDVLGHRSVSQRTKLLSTFKQMYGKDLKKELKSELSGNFLKTCLGLLEKPDEYDAKELKRAIKGLGTDEDALIEIICTRTNSQIKAFTAAYKRLYNKELEDDITSDTSGHFKRLLVSLLQAERDESKEYDLTKAQADAQELYDAGEKKWGTDESKFNQILCSRSYAHLRAVFDEYSKLSKKTIEEAIKSEMSGDIKNGMLTVARCIKNKPNYFAKALQKAMKGAGTDDDTLLRIIITRCEIDMVQIKEEFEKDYEDSLAQWIKDDTSGDYMKILLTLIGDEDKIKKKK